MRRVALGVFLIGCSSPAPTAPTSPTSPPPPPPTEPAVAPSPRGSIVVGEHHACAIQATGKVACWGQGGRLGIPGRTDQLAPVEVPGVDDVAGLSAMQDTTCAWTAHGAVWCWGGVELGLYESAELLPRRVPHLDDIVQVITGASGACGLRATGAVACWTSEAWEDPLWPPIEDLSGLAGIVEIAGDDRHLCARDRANQVTCSVIPDDKHYTITDQHMTVIPQLAGATSIAGFNEYFAALLPNHRLVTFDIADVEGRRSPAPASVFHTVAADGDRVYVGGDVVHEVSVCTIGKHPRCWPAGAIEDEDPAAMQAAAHVLEPGTQDLAVGTEVSCARVNDRARCWGLIGRLGDGDAELPAEPVLVKGIDDAIQLEAGMDDTCVLRKSGKVACWGGRFGFGDHGEPVIDYEPFELPGVSDAVEIAKTYDVTCARRKAGNATCWTTEMRGGAYAAVAAPELASATRLLSGPEVCGVDASQAVACTSFEVPAIHPANGAAELQAAIAAGKPLCVTSMNNDLTCVHGAGNITSEHTQNYDVWCAVAGGKIQCHYGSDPSRVFEEIPGLTNAVSYDGQWALLADGTVTSRARQTNHHYAAEPPLDKFANVVEFRANSRAMCARMNNGTVACWGPRDYLGAGQRGAPGSPVTVAKLVMGAARPVVPAPRRVDPVATPDGTTADEVGTTMTGPFADFAAMCKVEVCPAGQTSDCRDGQLPGLAMPAPPAPFASVRFVSMNCRDPSYRRDDEQTFRIVAERDGAQWVSQPLFKAGGNEKYCSATVQPRWDSRDLVVGGSPEAVATVLYGTSCRSANGSDRDEARIVVAVGAGAKPYVLGPVQLATASSRAGETVVDHLATFTSDGHLAVGGGPTYRFVAPKN